jgi:hypothetical protein
MALDIQLEGSIKFGIPEADGSILAADLDEFGLEISSLVIGRTRQNVSKPPTFGDASINQRAGALEEALTINFFNDETVATSFWALCWEAIETTPCELYFEATMVDAVPSATNPIFSGYVMVADLDSGGTVNEFKQQSKTWPARGVTKGIAPIVHA